MNYWVVWEVPHWLTPCVSLLFRNPFYMALFNVVVHSIPILFEHFFILHAMPRQKQSSLLYHLLVWLVWWLSGQGRATWKCPSTCGRVPSIIPRALLYLTDVQILVSSSVLSKCVFHSLSNSLGNSSSPISHLVVENVAKVCNLKSF